MTRSCLGSSTLCAARPCGELEPVAGTYTSAAERVFKCSPGFSIPLTSLKLGFRCYSLVQVIHIFRVTRLCSKLTSTNNVPQQLPISVFFLLPAVPSYPPPPHTHTHSSPLLSFCRCTHACVSVCNQSGRDCVCVWPVCVRVCVC